MIDNMLKASYTKVKLYHARMAFSTDMDEVGKFKLGKLVSLAQLIKDIYYLRFRYGIDTLYYPPAPPQKIPMLRDIIILNATRWLFKKVIFHFHAAGISEMHAQLNKPLQVLFERAYFGPDMCIRLSELNPEDGKFLKSKTESIVPNGLDDFAVPYLATVKAAKPVTILSVGVLCESKGVLVLLEAANLLAMRGHNFKVQLMGRFESHEFQQGMEKIIEKHQLGSFIEFLGVQTGDKKYSAFAQAHIFCFPTFFEAETFGLVALEAMQFELPVVATKWRGVPSVVQDQLNGFLVPPRDAHALADKLEILMKDPALRAQMGKKGRKIYCEQFTSEKHFEQLENAFTLA